MVLLKRISWFGCGGSRVDQQGATTMRVLVTILMGEVGDNERGTSTTIVLIMLVGRRGKKRSRHRSCGSALQWC